MSNIPSAPYILLVDDDELILSLLCQVLCKSGYMVAAATDRARALQLAAIAAPQLLVMDYSMPSGMDAAAFVGELRAMGVSAEIILATASARPDALADGLGAKFYLQKPFTTRELFATIAAALKS